MRRVTSFCVLVASMLILIQGARSEHAFRQNDRPPNALERDADKYNRPQIPSKLPINQQDQTDACPVTGEALVESVQTTEKGVDSATVLSSCTKRAVTQNPVTRYRRSDTSTPARRHRRKDTDTRDVARRTTSKRHRQRDLVKTDLVRRTTVRRHRRRDLSSADVVRRTTVRRHRRKDVATRNVVRQTVGRRDRRLERGTRDVVRHRLVLRQRQTRYSTQLGREVESRHVRRTLSPDSRRNLRRMVDVSVRSRSTASRNEKRERNNRLSRRDLRNTRGASYNRQSVQDAREDIRVLTSTYQHNGEVNGTDRSYTTYQDDKQDVMPFTSASTKSRSSRHIRREMHRSRGDRHLSIKTVSDVRLSERGHRIDVRRRFRHSDRRASRNTRRDVRKRFESVSISVPYDFNTVSVIDQLTMQASKDGNRNLFSFRSTKRVARRARLTRGYRRISSNNNGLGKANTLVSPREFMDHVDRRDTNLENVKESLSDRQSEIMPSEPYTSLDLGKATTEESVINDNSVVEERNNNGNRIMLQRRRRQEGQNSRSRVGAKRSVSRSINRSRRSADVRIRQGSRPAYSQRNFRRDSRSGRSARRHLKTAQHRARGLKRSSNDNATRRSVRKVITDNQNNFVSDVTRVNTERRIRYRQVRQRERSTRRVRRLRVARAAEAKNPDESEITDYKTLTGDNSHPPVSRQQTRTYRYLTLSYGSERRSRRNSRMEGRRSREVRSRRARRQVVDRSVSEYDSTSHYIQGHQNSYLAGNNNGLPLFNLVGSTRKPDAVVGGMARSRRSRHSERRGKLPLYSPKTTVVTTKSLDTHPSSIDVHVDQPHVSVSEQHISSQLSGAVGYCLNLIFSCASDLQNDEHSQQGTFPDDANHGMDSCTRGVMLGVVAVLGTRVVQTVSAPSLPLGRIRHGLLA